MNRFKLYLFSIVLLGILLLAVFGGNCEAKYTFNAVGVDKLHNSGGFWLQIFAASVRHLTNGDVDIKIYPGGEWGGGEEQYLEGIQLGTIDMACVSVPPISAYTDALLVFDMPFLFKDEITSISHLYKSSTSMTDFANEKLKQASEEAKFMVLGLSPTGNRGVGASKPLNSLEDLKGMKIRTTSSPVQVDTFNAMGAIATPMAFGELYTAMQLHDIDGFENPANNYVEMNFYEVTPYWMVTNHYSVLQYIAVSNKAWNSLPSAYQSILREAAVATGYNRSVWSIGVDKYLMEITVKNLAKKITYLSEEERQELRETVLAVLLEKYADDIGYDFLELLAKDDVVIENWLKNQ